MSDYDAINGVTPYALGEVTILFATISSIDDVAMTAIVSYRDDCYQELGITPETPIKFLYNCPSYTGAGHTAFDVEEEVYVMHYINTDDENIVKIVGHSKRDITPLCNIDFVYIIRETQFPLPNGNSICTLFNVGTLDVVDPLDYDENATFTFPCLVSEASSFLFTFFEEYLSGDAPAAEGNSFENPFAIAKFAEEIEGVDVRPVVYDDLAPYTFDPLMDVYGDLLDTPEGQTKSSLFIGGSVWGETGVTIEASFDTFTTVEPIEITIFDIVQSEDGLFGRTDGGMSYEWDLDGNPTSTVHAYCEILFTRYRDSYVIANVNSQDAFARKTNVTIASNTCYRSSYGECFYIDYRSAFGEVELTDTEYPSLCVIANFDNSDPYDHGDLGGYYTPDDPNSPCKVTNDFAEVRVEATAFLHCPIKNGVFQDDFYGNRMTLDAEVETHVITTVGSQGVYFVDAILCASIISDIKTDLEIETYPSNPFAFERCVGGLADFASSDPLAEWTPYGTRRATYVSACASMFGDIPGATEGLATIDPNSVLLHANKDISDMLVLAAVKLFYDFEKPTIALTSSVYNKREL